MNKTNIIALALVLIIAAAGTVSAFGFPAMFGKSADQTQVTAVQTALANNDYSAWQTAMTNLYTAQLTEANFQKQETQYQMQQTRKDVNTAIANNDYSAWQTAMTKLQTQRTPDLSQDAFNTIVQKYQKWQNNANSTTQHPNMGHRFGGMGFGGHFGN